MKKRAIVKLIHMGENIISIHIIARCPNNSIGIYTMNMAGEIYNRNFIGGKLTKNPIPINIYNAIKKCNYSTYRRTNGNRKTNSKIDIFYIS